MRQKRCVYSRLHVSDASWLFTKLQLTFDPLDTRLFISSLSQLLFPILVIPVPLLAVSNTIWENTSDHPRHLCHCTHGKKAQVTRNHGTASRHVSKQAGRTMLTRDLKQHEIKAQCEIPVSCAISISPVKCSQHKLPTQPQVCPLSCSTASIVID